MQHRTTLTEISKALNLSVSTISKSLSGSSEISLPTKQRVKEFAKQCNYVPNNFAASFRKGCTNTIGLVIPHIINPFYAKVLLNIENYLDQNGYKLITCFSNDSLKKEVKNISKMASGYVDGFIVCVSKEAQLNNEYSHIQRLITNQIPIVLFDRICEMLDCDKVIIDDYKTAFDTTKHLIEDKKFKNIIMVSLIDNLHHGKLRTKGFQDALATEKSNGKAKVLVADTIEDLRQKLVVALRNDKSVDAIFGVNEQAVIQAMHVTRHIKSEKANRKIIVAGFCNERLADYDASLIVVNQNAEEIGIQTAKLLLKQIKSTPVRGSFIKKINNFLS